MMSFASRVLSGALQVIKYPFYGWEEIPAVEQEKPALQKVGPPPEQLELQKVIFAAGAILPKIGAPALSGHSIGSAFVVSDYTMIYRSTEDMIASLGTGGWFKEAFGGADAALVYQASGLASGLSAVVGAVQLNRDFKNIAYSDAINDSKGSLLGRVSVLKNASLIGAGVGIAGFRGLSLFDAVKNITPSFGSASLAGRASYGLLFVGILLYALFFAVFAVVSGVKVYEGAKLKKKLDGKDLRQQIAVLQRLIKADSKVVLEKLESKLGKEAAKEALINEALLSGKEGLRALMKELNMAQVTDDQLEAIVKGVMSTATGKEEISDLLMVIGLQLKVQKVDAKKLAKMGRILNKEGMEALQAIKNGAVSEALIETIQKSSTKKLTENSILLVIFVFGVVAMAAALAFAAGPGIIVAAVLMLVFSLMSVAVDGYYLKQSYNDELPATHDKKLLAASTVLAVITLLTIVALVASGVVTMGIVPLVAGLILTTIWLAQNGVTLAIMNRNERLFKEKHPTLETFIEALETEGDGARIKTMLENFPKEVKGEINAELGRKKMLEAALAQARKVEEARKHRLEVLRSALMQYNNLLGTAKA